MTKSNRHKKFRKQEKAKTQLTGVKKLSKPKNVVEPTLRVKKILIREQLKSSSLSAGDGSSTSRLSSQVSDASSIGKESTDTGYTRRKQSIQELLSSSNHHNMNMRKEAVLGLQEMATLQINTVIRNLDKILAKIASLTSDQEGVVRKENLKLAEFVLSKITENQLRPFWSMLIAHLKCTMTHLIASVRYSALSFIELLVDHHSALLSESSPIILPGILGLISTSSKNNNNKGSVTRLKVEITGKQNDLTARLKVLRILSKCLFISSPKSYEIKKNSKPVSVPATEYLSLTYPFGYSWHQAEENELQRKYGVGICKCSSGSYADQFYSSITADPFSSPFTSDSSVKNSNFWSEFIESCIPILIETWVESGPLSDHSDGNDKKVSKKKFKQSYSVQIGSDIESNDATTGRRNGLHILNDSAVDSLLCITNLFADLIQRNGKSSSGETNNENYENSAKAIRKLFGQNLTKYFYSLMPYVSLQESRKKDVTSANLKLFLIAGELKMFDNVMKRKFHTFIEGAMESTIVEREHCESILSIMKYLENEKERELCTQFLIFAAKMGHCDVVAGFLSKLISPMRQDIPKSTQEFLTNLKWDHIVKELMLNWSNLKNKYEEVSISDLMELLTFVALRRLTDCKSFLVENISTLKDLISLFKSALKWDTVYRAFFYSDAVTVFRTEFTDVLPENYLSFH